MNTGIRSISLGLAWRVCLAQVFTVLIAVMALILTWGDQDTVPMDMFAADAVVAALHSDGHAITLDRVRWEALNDRAGGNLWFVALDERGNRLSEGAIPDVHRELLSRLDRVGSSELGSLTPPYLDAARIVISNEGGRRLSVMVGGQPKRGLWEGADRRGAGAAVPTAAGCVESATAQ
jgi:hypothetical protein